MNSETVVREVAEVWKAATENGCFPFGVPSIYSADRHFESTSDSQINLRSGAMVEAQHPAESLSP